MYDPAFNWVFVTMSNNSPGSSNSSWLQIYDGDTLKRISTTIQTDQKFLASLVTEPARDRVWLSGGFPGSTTTVFSRDGKVQAHFEGLGGNLFLDPSLNKVYAGDWGGLVSIETPNPTVSDFRTMPAYSPGFMLYDRSLHRFYLNSTNSGYLSVINPQDKPATARSLPSTAPGGSTSALQTNARSDVYTVMSNLGEGGYGLFRVDGDAWLALNSGLPPHMQARLVAAQDAPGVLFAYSQNIQDGAGPFRSSDGGATWQVSGRGLTDFRVVSMALSPAFSKDGTAILATSQGALYETHDGGLSWSVMPNAKGFKVTTTLVAGQPRFVALGQDPGVYTDTVVYSGTFDRVLRSIMNVSTPVLSITALAAPLDSTAQPTVLVWSTGNPITGQSAGFLRSEDGGQTWTFSAPQTGVGPGYTTIVFSPNFAGDHAAYALIAPYFYQSSDKSALVRSLDSGRTWQRAEAADPLTSALAVLPDGRLLLGNTKGAISQISPDRLSWSVLPMTSGTGTPTAAPAAPTPVPTPAPSSTTTAGPPANHYGPDPAFQQAWQAGKSQAGLGWAVEDKAREVWVALQYFEHGRMIWREDRQTISALGEQSRLATYADTWKEGEPAQDPTIVPPVGKVQPQRGFGKLWRTVPGLRDTLGWALNDESGYTALVQDFENGSIIRIGNDTYVLLSSGASPQWLQP